METVNCDFCEGSGFIEITTQTDILHKSTSELFKIVECTQCKLNFLNPRPTMQEIGQYYTGSYSFHQSNSKIKFLLSFALDKVANSIFCYLFILAPSKIQKLLSRRIKPDIKDPILENAKQSFGKQRILDIGCGSGHSAHFWGTSGSLTNYKNYAQAFGVEVHAASREILQSKGIESFGSLEEMAKYCSGKSLKFDAIRMNWSLEHVHSPSIYFKFMSEFVAEDGTIYINIPNYDGFLYRLAKDLVEVPIHLFHFKLKDIENYAGKFSLKIASHQTFSQAAMLIHAGEVYAPFNNFAELSLLECLSMQKFLSTIDRNGLGNDLLIQLKKA